MLDKKTSLPARRRTARCLTFERLDCRTMMDGVGINACAITDNLPPFEGPTTVGLAALPATATSRNAVMAANAVRPVLEKGPVRADSITSRGQFDEFTFAAKAGQTLELAVARDTISNFRPRVFVYRPDGNLFRTIDVPGLMTSVQFVIPDGVTGTFLVRVQDDNLQDTGRYKIGLESISPPSPNPTSLNFGVITQGQISESIEKDQFIFTAKGGQKLELSVARESISNFKPRVLVFRPDGTLLKSFDATGLVADAPITIPNGMTGTYLVQVQDDNLLDTGRYKLGLESISPPSPNSIALTFGKSYRMKINETIQKDQFTFAAKAGQRFDLTVGRDSISNFKPRVFVYRPDGTLLKTVDVTGLVATAQITVPSGLTGTFLIQVQDDSLVDTGAYTITLAKR